jgi:hypothetical protein
VGRGLVHARQAARALEVLDLICAATPAAVAEARAGGARRYCSAVGGFGSVLHANRSG